MYPDQAGVGYVIIFVQRVVNSPASALVTYLALHIT